MKKYKNIEGFTLIELLAVIIILGVLLIIAVPSINRLIKQSEEKVFVSEALMYINAAKNHVTLNDTGEQLQIFSSEDLGAKKDERVYVAAVDKNDDGKYAYYIYMISNNGIIVDKKGTYYMCSENNVMKGECKPDLMSLLKNDQKLQINLTLLEGTLKNNEALIKESSDSFFYITSEDNEYMFLEPITIAAGKYINDKDNGSHQAVLIGQHASKVDLLLYGNDDIKQGDYSSTSINDILNEYEGLFSNYEDVTVRMFNLSDFIKFTESKNNCLSEKCYTKICQCESFEGEVISDIFGKDFLNSNKKLYMWLPDNENCNDDGEISSKLSTNNISKNKYKFSYFSYESGMFAIGSAPINRKFNFLIVLSMPLNTYNNIIPETFDNDLTNEELK